MPGPNSGKPGSHSGRIPKPVPKKDPAVLTRRGFSPVVTDGRECVKCKYDLTGLHEDNVCPECGTPISATGEDSYEDPWWEKWVASPKFESPLVESPRAYLNRLAWGGPALFWGAVAMVPMLGLITCIGGYWIVYVVLLSVALLGALLWTAGALGLCGPRRIGGKKPRVCVDEFVRSRAAVMLTQWAWPVGLAVLLLDAVLSHQGSDIEIGWLGGVLLLVASAGMPSAGFWVGFLADWADDTTSGRRIRGGGVLIGAGGFFAATAAILISTLGHRAGFAFLAAACSFLALIGMLVGGGMMLAGLRHFASVTRWAVASQEEAMWSLERRAEKVRNRVESNTTGGGKAPKRRGV